MKSPYAEIFPPPETVLELEPEELAVYLLEAISKDKRLSHPQSATNENILEGYCDLEMRERIARNTAEAWVWLEREGLIAPKPGAVEWRFVTRRGERFLSESEPKSLQHASLLQPKMISPSLSAKVRPDFIRGDLESAVFKAFKEVEVRVREAGCFSASDLGVKLMRAAFATSRGPLSDKTVEEGEQEGMAHLFAGAIQAFKNPSSHKDVDISDPHEAAELIIFADLLLRIVDRRTPETATG